MNDMQRFADDLVRMFTTGNRRNNKTGTVIEPKGVEPDESPMCPHCRKARTTWRGPHPTMTDPPIATEVRFGKTYKNIVMPDPDAPRLAEARRLYKIADRYSRLDEPAPFGPKHWLWQAALCWECEESYLQKWFRHQFPPVETTNGGRGGRTARL